jgi:predicted P-loop ATPase
MPRLSYPGDHQAGGLTAESSSVVSFNAAKAERQRNHDGTDAVRDHLILSKSGAIKPQLANAIITLREDFSCANILAFDAFANETIINRAPPWCSDLVEWTPRAWGPHDDLLLAHWLQQRGIGVSPAIAAQAVEVVARDLTFHPALDYLNSLQHDGTARLESWLMTYLGAEQSDYNKIVGRAMFIAAVARIRYPGCKVDNVPILEGAQGARKSTAIKALFDPWFSDELAELGSKDAAMQTRGVWGIEVSELDAMSRAEVSKIKAFISRTTDRFRPPYGSRIVESPRSCVFWGTTNSDCYLKDETGGRRFWPVKIGRIDVDGLIEVRDQLWAEADILYQANVPWWITKSEVEQEAEHQQRSRYTADAWEPAISDYIETKYEVTIEEVLRSALFLEIGRWGQAEMNRVTRCLRSLGLVRIQVRRGDKRVWIYRKPVTSPVEFPGDRTVTSFKPVTAARVVTPEKPPAPQHSPLSPVSPLEEDIEF